MGSLVAPLSCSPSSLQEGATLVHAAVLGNQVIPRVGRRHLPLPVSTARGLCSPFPSHQELGLAPQCGSGEGRVSRRLPRALASCCRVPSTSEATSGSGQGATRCQPCLPAQLRAASVPRGVEG